MGDIREMLGGKDSKYKIDKKAAEATVSSIFDYYEIEIEELEDKEAKKFIKANYDRLVKAARLGRLEVDMSNGILVKQHLRTGGDPLEYKEIDGKSKAAMAGKDANDFYGRIYAIQGSLCGLGESAIQKMKGVDLSLCEVLGAVFLQC